MTVTFYLLELLWYICGYLNSDWSRESGKERRGIEERERGEGERERERERRGGGRERIKDTTKTSTECS